MRKLLHLLGILTTSLFLLAGPASAQVPPIYNWTGFYVGVNTGAGWAHTGWSDPFGPPFDMGSDRGTGWQFGGQAGVNYQAGMWVFGIEGHLASLRIDSGHFDPGTLGAVEDFLRDPVGWSMANGGRETV